MAHPIYRARSGVAVTAARQPTVQPGRCVTISPMAQGLGEYGMLAGGKAGEGASSSSLQDIVAAVEDAIRNPTPRTWVALGVFLFILWFFLLRRRR